MRWIFIIFTALLLGAGLVVTILAFKRSRMSRQGTVRSNAGEAGRTPGQGHQEKAKW